MKKLLKINLVIFMQGITLFIIALAITIFFTLISLVFDPIFYIITLKWQTGFNRIGEWLKNLAISIDQFGNVSSATILNFALRKKGGLDFGEIDDTISYVLGRNYHHKTLTIMGKIIVGILNLIEKNHVDIAIYKKIDSDQEAMLRCQQDEYFK
jgi:hypothetical protein